MRTIDADALHAKICEDSENNYGASVNIAQVLLYIETAPTIEAEPVRPADRLGKKIAQLIQQHKVFYAFNDVGETFRNYMLSCKTSL